MFPNLGIGAVLVSATVVIHTVGLIALSAFIRTLTGKAGLNRHDLGRTAAMIATVLGIFFIHTVEVWLWAAAFLALQATGDFESALYISTATFSTVGAADQTLDPYWRLLGSLEAVNGFILIGWSTAYLVAASTRHGPFRIGEHF